MLTDNQRHYILNILRHIESETQQGITALEDDDPQALFPRYSDFPDATSIARLRSHLTRMRSVMRRFMNTQGIRDSSFSPIDASWAFQTRMVLARNAAFELAPSHIRGYGALDAQGEEDCRALMAELGLLLDDVAGELRRQPLAVSIRATSDTLLVAVVDVIERHHLLDLRPAARDLLTALQGRQRVEIAVLGRVSSGKSSLVNALLGQPLLPVGAIPVTAVVTRVQYGEAIRARTRDIEGREQDISISQLAQYIAESSSMDNRLRLREVVIDLPHCLLQQGIVLTDTPGLGSLHPRASAHALTYLPRCDLGVIAIDAGATLQPQDIDLARALVDAHALCLVVLTKADTVTQAALEEQRGYVEHAMSQALGATVAAADVSVVEGYVHPLEAWQKEVLQPALGRAVAQSDQRAQARLISLGRKVCVALENTQRGGRLATDDRVASAAGGALAALNDAESALRRLIGDLGYRGASVVLRDSLHEVIHAAEPVGARIASMASQLADEVVRDILARLKEVASALGSDTLEVILRGAPPFVFAPEHEPRDRPRYGPAPWLRYRWQRLLNETYAGALQTAFQSYSQELVAWLHQTTQVLRQQLGADVLYASSIASPDGDVTVDLQRLRKLLAPATSPAARVNPSPTDEHRDY